MHDYFERPVTLYMAQDLEIATPETPVEELARTMHGRGVSGLPIVDNRGKLVGVVSRTDLIQLGALRGGRRWSAAAMTLPARVAREVMTPEPRVIPATTSLREAARIMSDLGIHRLFVTDHQRLAGVICAVDFTAAVSDARLETPIGEVMTTPIISLDVKAPLGAAVDLLARAPITGVIVTEECAPVGVFTQLDALASRDLPRSTPLEDVFDPAVICLPEDTKLHRAAAHAAQLDIRRVVVCRDRTAIGVVSGLDFARVAGAAPA